jgi:hypothetical protein
MMPNPEGDGKGGPTSNVANILQTAMTVASDSVAAHGTEAGIIIIGGSVADDLNPQPLPPGPSDSFWNQAAAATHDTAATGALQVTAVSEVAAIDTTTTTTTHDVSTTLERADHAATLGIVTTHDAGFATTGLAHMELGSMTHLDTSSLSGAFAHQMLI